MSRPGLFVVFSKPTATDPDTLAAYHRWYDEVHGRDSLLLPGFVSGRRFKLADEQLLPAKAAGEGFDFLAIYELDDVTKVPEARALMPALAGVSSEFASPAMDFASVKAFIFEQISSITEPTELPPGVTFPPAG